MVEIGPGDAEYRKLFRMDTFKKVAKELLTENGKTFANGGTVEKVLQPAFMKSVTPTFDEMFANADFTPSSIKLRKSTLRKSRYVKDNAFTIKFVEDYVPLAQSLQSEQRNARLAVDDSVLKDEIIAHTDYSLEDVTTILGRNPEIKFKFPEGAELKDLNLNKYTVQYSTLNHMGVGVDSPFHIAFCYKCNHCNAVMKIPNLLKSQKCKEDDCDGYLVRKKDMDLKVPCEISSITYKKSNRDISLSVASLVSIPDGDFNAAYILTTDDKNTEYSIVILAVEEKQYTTASLQFEPHRHVAWQLIDRIDALHEERMDTHIDGLDHIKAGILLAAIGNASGYKSFNVSIVGRAGTGKTTLCSMYTSTLSDRSKVQDGASLSMPGLVGSSTQIDLNGRKLPFREPGLLTRYDLVVIDEFYSLDAKVITDLKKSLLSPEISKEVAGNRTTQPKNATVYSTANVPPEFISKIKDKKNEYTRIFKADPETFKYHNQYTEKVYRENPFLTEENEIINKAIEYEFEEKGYNWMDGLHVQELDRFALLFYLGDPLERTKDFSAEAINSFSDKIDRHGALGELYSPEIREYIHYCSQINVEVDSDTTDKITDFVDQLYEMDHIHTDRRFLKNVTKMLQYSAKLNQRNYLEQMDFDFVKKIYSATCHWVEPEDMRLKASHVDTERDDSTHGGAGDVGQAPVTRAAVEAFVGERAERYDLFNLDQNMWLRALQNIIYDLTDHFRFQSYEEAEQYVIECLGLENTMSNSPFDEPDVIVASSRPVNPFKNLPQIDEEELLSTLIDTLAKYREIPKDSFEIIITQHGIDQQLLNDHLSEIKRRGMVMDAGDSYVWTG